MKVPLPATISKVTTMRDKTIRLQVDCQEIPAENMAELFALNDALGWFFFHERPLTQIDTKNLPEIKIESWEKSPGQRLKASLYRLWEQHKTDEDFETYYRRQMEKIIEAVKEKLN